MTTTPDHPTIDTDLHVAPAELDITEPAAAPPLPRRPPVAVRVSGLYAASTPMRLPIDLPTVPVPVDGPVPDPLPGDPGPEGPAALWPLPLLRSIEHLRLDVDGAYPQLAASGTIARGLVSRAHWVASLTPAGANRWQGGIWHKDGDVAAVPHAAVTITVVRRPFGRGQLALVVFTGGGAPDRLRTYSFRSPHLRTVEFEYDATPDAAPVARIDTGRHPNRPPTLPAEPLSIEAVYERAGFDVRKSGGDGVVPVLIAAQNADPRWSDSEMHDAMQAYWSRFSSSAQWSLWVLWAAQHETGPSLGGVMFDDIGPQHRQGTSIFTNSFIAQAPGGDADPVGWVDRMKFWTAVHEMGHAFNLAHSWQKSLGTPWIPLADEPEARSFMNYPYNVQGGQAAFFADFEYAFTDSELLFMRHAPERLVRMGDAAWFDHHGFEAPPEQSTMRLTVRANRESTDFDFLEPVILELKLTNAGDRPLVIDRHVLESGAVTAVMKRRGHEPRQWLPYARYCREPGASVLEPGRSVYASLPVFAGCNGWDISDPGLYEVQVAVRWGDAFVVSDPLAVRVRPPLRPVEEHVAQDLFTDEAGRALAFGGTAVLSSGIRALEAVVDEAPDTRAALHAEVALAAPLAVPYKVLEVPEADPAARSATAAGGAVRVRPPRVDEAHERLEAALLTPGPAAAETFGHVGYKARVDHLSEVLDEGGDAVAAARAQEELLGVLADRAVLPEVLAEVADRARSYGARA